MCVCKCVLSFDNVFSTYMLKFTRFEVLLRFGTSASVQRVWALEFHFSAQLEQSSNKHIVQRVLLLLTAVHRNLKTLPSRPLVGVAGTRCDKGAGGEPCVLSKHPKQNLAHPVQHSYSTC